MSSAWKVAYADFVTAMMAFFLLLWILNMVPPETKAGLAAYFSGERNFDSSSTSHVSNNPFIQNTDKINTQDSITINETQKSHIAIAKKLKEMIMADAIPQNASGINADDVGVQLRIMENAFNGFGFDGVAVALLGGNAAGGIALSSLLFGALKSGATKMQMKSGVPTATIYMLQGLIILFVVGKRLFDYHRLHKKPRKHAVKEGV